ncbi:hypothetical protein Z043_112709, partial [Scleropages formosus]
VLYLLEHDEEYVFTLPSAYARSILTVPWVELGGKVSITCAKSGYSASVTFHNKPFYGGKVHRVTAEVKHNSTNTIVCKAQGEWNRTLEFTYNSGEIKVIDTSKLPIIKKRIRPLEKQGQHESRRLWQHVTAALKKGNIDGATEHKHQLEECQRAEERQRAAANMPWKPKYFVKEGDADPSVVAQYYSIQDQQAECVVVVVARVTDEQTLIQGESKVIVQETKPMSGNEENEETGIGFGEDRNQNRYGNKDEEENKDAGEIAGVGEWIAR